MLKFKSQYTFPTFHFEQCVLTTAPERGWGGHFHTSAVFLSTLTLIRRHFLLECGKGLLAYHVNVIKMKWEIIWTGGLPHQAYSISYRQVTPPTLGLPPQLVTNICLWVVMLLIICIHVHTLECNMLIR